jgi:hypothetical protein
MLTKAVPTLTKGKPMNQSIVAEEPGAPVAPSPSRNKMRRPKASPQAERILQAEDDSRVWDILGRVEFQTDAGDSSAPKGTPLPERNVEADEDVEVWDILGRVEFSDN